MAVRTYDPKRIIITIGSHVVSGYAEDTFISIEETGDGVSAMAGADGEVGRSVSNNPLHDITLTVMATSPTNDYLSRLRQRDRASGGAGVVPFTLRDLNGTTLFVASQAWVVKMPTQEYGATLGEREWALQGVVTTNFAGGGLL
jgi:hypothetical protein